MEPPAVIPGGDLVSILDKGGLPAPFGREILLLQTYVAGTGYVPGVGDLVSSMNAGERLILRREPDNPHDRMAILVLTVSGTKVGYIPRRDNTVIARLMDAGKAIYAVVTAVGPGEHPPRINVDVMMHDGYGFR